MLDARVGYLFMPHGLGHLVGLDVHDVGGYLKNTPQRVMKPGLKNLRTSRVMEKNLLITVEPGCYFRDYLFTGEYGDKLPIESKYVNIDKAREYQKEVSGVRIEDVVLITETGCENLSADLPRTVEEIELCMRKEEL
jgi:Xaa-Pro dipeptidase